MLALLLSIGLSVAQSYGGASLSHFVQPLYNPEHHGLSWCSIVKLGSLGFAVGYVLDIVLSTTLC